MQHLRPLGISLENKLPIEPQLSDFAEVGFTSYFPLYDNYQNCCSACKYVKDAGFDIPTIHAPFYGINNIWLKKPEGDEMARQIMDCITLCGKESIPVAVVHLSSGVNCPHVTNAGLDRFEQIVRHAEKCDVKVAFENQRKLSNIAYMFETYWQDPHVGFCWDCGHEPCFAGGRDFLALFGSQICAVHLHDNHCVDNGDEHLIPFYGTIDFDRVAHRLVNTCYKGPVMLEVFPDSPSALKAYGDISHKQFARLAAQGAARLRDLMEQAEKDL